VLRIAAAMGDKPWVLVADRGFGRAEFLRMLDNHGIKFVIRVAGNTWMRHSEFSGLLCNIPRHPGMCRLYKNVRYRKADSVAINLVVCHREPAPEPWYLATNLNLRARKIQKLYTMRMSIEQAIRDCKSAFGLKHLRLSTADRMNRAMILIAIAYIIAVLTALKTLADRRALKLSNNKRRNKPLSLLSIGLRTIGQYPRLLCINLNLLAAA